MISKAQAKLHVYGELFWGIVADAFGSTLSSLGQGMLPLGITERDDIDTEDLYNKVKEFKVGDAPFDWEITIPAGKTKRTTIGKKLKSLFDLILNNPSSSWRLNEREEDNETDENNKNNNNKITSEKADVPFTIQFETKRRVKGEMEDVVLFRICPSINEMYTGVISDEHDFHSTLHANAVGGPLSFQRYGPILKSLERGDPSPWDRENDFVDTFYLNCLLVFKELILDIAHLILFAITAITPWRMFDVVYELFSRLQSMPYKNAKRIFNNIAYGEQHLSEYIRDFRPLHNEECKRNDDSYKYNENTHLWQPASMAEDGIFKQYKKCASKTTDLVSNNSEWFAGLKYFFREREVLHSEQLELIVLKNLIRDKGFDNYCAARELIDDASKKSTLTNQELRYANVKLDNSNTIGTALIASYIERNRNALQKNRQNLLCCYQNIAEHCHMGEKVFIPGLDLDAWEVMKLSEDKADKSDESDKLAAVGVSDIEAPSKSNSGSESESKSEITALSFKMPTQKKSGKMCLFHNSIAETRKMIRTNAFYVVRDVGILLVIGFILCTVFTALPLFRDLYELRSIDIRKYKVRMAIQKNLLNVFSDLFDIVLFFFWFTIVVCSVVGIIPFLSDLPLYLTSFRAATKFAKSCAKNAGIYLCKTLWYLVNCRTYYLILNSALYGLLMPAACVGDIISGEDDEDFYSKLEKLKEEPTENQANWVISSKNRNNRTMQTNIDKYYKTGGANSVSSTMWTFLSGGLVWLLLILGAALSTYEATEAGDHKKTASEACLSCLLMCLFLTIFLALVYGFVWKRKEYDLPAPSSKCAPIFSYHHLLALLTAPFEMLQLSAVIMYFFWNDASKTEAGAEPSGQAAWVMNLLQWGSSSSSGRTGGESGYVKSTHVHV